MNFFVTKIVEDSDVTYNLTVAVCCLRGRREYGQNPEGYL